jgi:hypothetical protein
MFAVVPMPKASMDEDHFSIFREDQVWVAGQIASVQSIAKPPAVQFPPYDHFGPCILALDPGHQGAARRGRERICHEG